MKREGNPREIALLNAVAEALHGSTDVQQALERMLGLVAGLLGLRAGWVLSPIDGHWQLHEQDVAGGPELGIDGPYVRFMIGGGGIHD